MNCEDRKGDEAFWMSGRKLGKKDLIKGFIHCMVTLERAQKEGALSMKLKGQFVHTLHLV